MKYHLAILFLHLVTFCAMLAALEHYVTQIYFYEGFVWTPNEACAVIIAAIFKYIEACAHASGDRALITAAVAVPVFAMITYANLPTAFLTHGLYVNLLLIACFHGSDTSNAYSPLKQRASA